LRGAFPATLADREFLFQAGKFKLDVTYVSGQEIEKVVNSVLSTSPKVKEDLQFLYQEK
jgi:hypothetical protein